MNIQLNPEQIEAAINSHINKAVEQALAGYEVRQAISEKLTRDIASGVVGEALNNAVASIDSHALTQKLAEEIQRAMTGAVVNLLHAGLADTLLRMRGLNDYSQGYKEERARIIAELRQA